MRAKRRNANAAILKIHIPHHVPVKVIQKVQFRLSHAPLGGEHLQAEVSGTIWGPRRHWSTTENCELLLRRTGPNEVTQMGTNENEHRVKTPAKQGSRETPPEPNKINASTPCDFWFLSKKCNGC